MAFEGDLSTTALPKALQRIALQRSTGILTIQGQNDIVAVSFLDGEIVAADALNQTVEEGVGRVLVEEDEITAEDLFRAASRMQQEGLGNIHQALVREGLVERPRLLEALRVHTYQSMMRLLRWKQGEFKFYPGDEVSYEEGIEAIPVEELLIRSLIEKDPRNEAKLPELDVPYRRLAVQKPIRVLGRDGDGSEPAIWLTPDESAIWDRLPSGRTAQQIVGELGIGRYKSQYALLRMRQHRLIEAAPDAVPAAPAAEPAPEVEIFRPPDPEEMERHRQRAAAARSEQLRPSAPRVTWPGVAVAVVGVLALLAALVLRPLAVAVPLPWQEATRASLITQIRASLYHKIDRAARAERVVEDTFPESLRPLVDAHWLSAADLRDPAGRRVAYTGSAASYSVGPEDRDENGAVVERSGSIAGDLHLDPQLIPEEETRSAPLRLLD